MVDDGPIVVPALAELGIQRLLFGVVADALVAPLRLRNGAIELYHFPFDRIAFGRVRRQQVVALGGAEVRRIVVEIAEYTRIGQPHIRDIGGHVVEVAKPRNAQHAEKKDQQEEEDEHQRQVESDGAGLPHWRRPCCLQRCVAPRWANSKSLSSRPALIMTFFSSFRGQKYPRIAAAGASAGYMAKKAPMPETRKKI